MPLPSLVLYGLSIVVGTVILIYGLSLRSPTKGASSGSDWCSSSGDPLSQTDEALTIDFTEAPRSFVSSKESDRMENSPGLVLSGNTETSATSRPSSSFSNILKAPLRRLKFKRSAKGEDFTDKPVAMGTVLGPDAGEGPKEPGDRD